MEVRELHLAGCFEGEELVAVFNQDLEFFNVEKVGYGKLVAKLGGKLLGV